MDEQLQFRADDQFKGSLKRKKKLLNFKTVGGVLKRRWSQENFTNNAKNTAPWKGKRTTGDKKLKKFKEMFEDDESDSEKSTSKEMKAKKPLPGRERKISGSKQTNETSYLPNRNKKNVKGLKCLHEDEDGTITKSRQPVGTHLTPDVNTHRKSSQVSQGENIPSLTTVVTYANNQKRQAEDIASGLVTSSFQSGFLTDLDKKEPTPIAALSSLGKLTSAGGSLARITAPASKPPSLTDYENDSFRSNSSSRLVGKSLAASQNDQSEKSKKDGKDSRRKSKETLSSIRSALRKVQESDDEPLDLEQLLRQLMLEEVESANSSMDKEEDKSIQLENLDDKILTLDVHRGMSDEIKPRASLSAPILPAIHESSTSLKQNALSKPQKPSFHSLGQGRKQNFSVDKESLPSLSQIRSDTPVTVSENDTRITGGLEKESRDYTGTDSNLDTNELKRISFEKSPDKPGVIMYLAPKTMVAPNHWEATALHKPSLQKVEKSQLRRTTTAEKRTMEVPDIRFTNPSSSSSSETALPKAGVQWRNTIEFLEDNDTLHRKTLKEEDLDLLTTYESSISETGDFTELHMPDSTTSTLHTTELRNTISAPMPNREETFPDNKSISTKKRTIKSRQKSIMAIPLMMSTQNEEINENRSLPEVQEGGAVGLVGEEPKLKPQLKQVRPREEENDQTIKRTADKAIQMSLNSGLDHAGEEDVAEKAKEPPPTRLKTEPTTINEQNSTKDEKWSPLHERIPTLSSTQSRTSTRTQGTLDARHSMYTLRVPRPHENASGHKQQPNTPTTRNRTMNWSPAFELLRQAKERAQREGRYQYSERLGRYVYLSESDHENNFSSDSSDSLSDQDMSVKERESIPKVFRRSGAIPTADGPRGEIIPPHDNQSTSRNLNENEEKHVSEESWSDSDDMEYESWLARRTRIPLVWVHWEKRRAMKRLEGQFKEPTEPLMEIAKHFDESELEIYAQKIK